MKHLIWTNDLNYNDWKESLESQYPSEEGFTEDDRIKFMYEFNDEQFEDERTNLNMELERPIVMIGSMQLWYGKRVGYKFLKGTNLKDILSGSVGDIVTWYVENNEIQCTDIHHDGTNHYLYRILKKEYEKEDFEDYVYDHSVGEASDLMTEPMGQYVASIYGF